jgi:hypothetical protein
MYKNYKAPEYVMKGIVYLVIVFGIGLALLSEIRQPLHVVLYGPTLGLLAYVVDKALEDNLQEND